jgi:cytochrome c oxidase cbb3-type subunit 2
MNRSFLIFAGVLFTVVASLSGLVLVPDWQFKDVQPIVDEASGETYPVPLTDQESEGRLVYMDLGCIYCHSQQVRPEGFGADLDRGWGTRRTVIRDYLYDQRNLLGSMRTGPDLANIGARQPSRQWHYLHLYNPQITSKGSIMPQYPFLFETGEAENGQIPANAFSIPEEYRKPGVNYIVPKPRGRFLVDYLLALDKSFPLPEAE